MLTVLIPIYSIDKHLNEALLSIKNQTYREYTCHLLCKKFNEEERNTINSIINNDDRFVLHELKLDGIAFALNYGLNLVETKYVARMDADDISDLTRFEKQINFLENNPKHVMVGCFVKIIDENSQETVQKFKFFKDNKNIRKALKYRMPMCHPALIFRTNILFKYKGYMYGNTAEDHEIYLRIARDKNNLFENLEENLFFYRKRKNQLTDLSNAHESFYDISGFLFSEFLRTFNPLYIVGMVATHPFFRKSRAYIRVIKKTFMSHQNKK